MGSERQPSKVHSQNTLVLARILSAAENQRKGALGSREGEFFFDEITLGERTISVEVRVMAQTVLVAIGGEGKIDDPRLTKRVSTGENRERRRARRIKGRRGRSRGFLVTLNPGELAAGV